jgi:thiamine transporter ThiT
VSENTTVVFRVVVVVVAIIAIAFVLQLARQGESAGWRHTLSEVVAIIVLAILVGWLGGEAG